MAAAYPAPPAYSPAGPPPAYDARKQPQQQVLQQQVSQQQTTTSTYQTTTVEYQQVPVQVQAVHYAMMFGESPCSMICPYCGNRIITATSYKVGSLTWIVAGIVCAVGLVASGFTWLGCCLIPFCIRSLKDVHHKCPNCCRVVGVYTRSL